MVEQNSSGEEEVPDEDDEVAQQVYEPVYIRYAGMLPAQAKLLGTSDASHTSTPAVGEPRMMMNTLRDPLGQEPVEMPMFLGDAGDPVNGNHNGNPRSQREDALMELVEFALEMDARKPKMQTCSSLVRSSSDINLSHATIVIDEHIHKRAKSLPEKSDSYP